MNQRAATLMAGLASVANRILAAMCGLLMGPQANAYRPEAYYMRGPGPKWREKHGRSRDSALH